jgi:hypothetical protein
LDYTEPTEAFRPRLSIILNIRYQSGSPAQLIWERETTSIIVSDPPCDYVNESLFKIPANMVLTKVTPTLD